MTVLIVGDPTHPMGQRDLDPEVDQEIDQDKGVMRLTTHENVNLGPEEDHNGQTRLVGLAEDGDICKDSVGFGTHNHHISSSILSSREDSTSISQVRIISI